MTVGPLTLSMTPPVGHVIPGLPTASIPAPPGWFAAPLDAAAKGTVLLLGAWALTAALRRAPAALRHLTWLTALAGLLVLPVLAHTLPAWRIAARAERPADTFGGTTPGRDAAAAAIPVPSESAADVHVPDAAAPADPDAGDSAHVGWWAWAGVAWLGGTVVALVPVLGGVLAARRIARRAHRCDDAAWANLLADACREMGLRRPPALLFGGPGAMPITLGLLRPAVLLPRDADRWPAERRRVVLLHELAHVRRRDCLTQWVARLARSVYWFNPLAWLAVHRLRAEQERACDDLVLAGGARPSDYAEHLLSVARSLAGRGGPAPLAAVASVAMARPSQLRGRLVAILDSRRSHRPAGRATAAAVVVVTAAALVPLSMLRVTRAADEQGPESQSARDQRDQEAAKLARLIEDLAKDHEDDPKVITARSENLMRLEKELQTWRDTLNRAEADVKAAAKGPKPTAEDWARVDKTMEHRVAMRNDLAPRIDALASQLGKQHNAVVQARIDMQTLERAIAQYADELDAKFLILWKKDGSGGTIIPKDLTALKDSVARAQALYDREAKKVSEMRVAARQIENAKQRLAQLRGLARPAAAAAAPAAAADGHDDAVLTARRLELLKLESALRDAQDDLADAEQQVRADRARPEDFARVDDTARDLQRRRNELKLKVEDLTARNGADHPEVKAAERQLLRAEEQASQYAKELAERFVVRWKADGTPVLFPRDLSALKAKVARLKERVDAETARIDPQQREEAAKLAVKVAIANLDSAKFQVEAAKADLEKKKVDLRRIQEVYRDQLARDQNYTNTEIDEVRANVTIGEVAVKFRQAELERAKWELEAQRATAGQQTTRPAPAAPGVRP